jgi:hypothetical protein
MLHDNGIGPESNDIGKLPSTSQTNAQLEVSSGWSPSFGLIFWAGLCAAFYAFVIWEFAPRRWLVIGVASAAVILVLCMAKYIVYSAHREMEKKRGPYHGNHVIR